MPFWNRTPESSQNDDTSGVIMVSPELAEQLQRLYNLDTAKLSKQEMEHAKVIASEKAFERERQ